MYRELRARLMVVDFDAEGHDKYGGWFSEDGDDDDDDGKEGKKKRRSLGDIMGDIMGDIAAKTAANAVKSIGAGGSFGDAL